MGIVLTVVAGYRMGVNFTSQGWEPLVGKQVKGENSENYYRPRDRETAPQKKYFNHPKSFETVQRGIGRVESIVLKNLVPIP